MNGSMLRSLALRFSKKWLRSLLSRRLWLLESQSPPSNAPKLFQDDLMNHGLVDVTGIEPATSCAQGSCKKSILSVRLALFCVMVDGFGPNLAVVGPKLDPNFSLRSGRRQAGAASRAPLSSFKVGPLVECVL
jgi:hypothetical protein